MNEVTVQLTVDGIERTVRVDPRLALADLLRDELTVTGVRIGCEQGACGACVVLLNGEPACSCLALAAEASGSEVETIEQLSRSGRLADLQAAFVEHGAFQCGFCTAGFLVLGDYLINQGLAGDRDAVVDALHTNICRCTGYGPIIDAIMATAERRAAASGGGA